MDRENGTEKSFSSKTSTGVLRNHIDKFHRARYLAVCKEKGLTSKLLGDKKAAQTAEEGSNSME